MASIFLGGGGNETQSYQLDRLFVERLGARKILYLPIAQSDSGDGYAGCFDWFTRAMARHGVTRTRITMWTELTGRSLEECLEFGAVYIGGGITGRLNQLLRQSCFPEVARRAVRGEILVYGGSAGAIVLGQTLDCVPEEIEEHFPERAGLGVVPKYSFRCHYNPEQISVIEQIKGLVSDGSHAVIALPETSGLTFDGRNIRVVGDTVTCWTANESRAYRPGENVAE